jgi:hypothetical protein
MTPRTSHPGQLDLFLHSGAVVFANDAIDALRKRDAARAADCLRRLFAEEPAYRTLGALQILCRAVQDWPFPAASPIEIADAVRRLETEVQPAADLVMREEARSFMRTFWCDLANAASHHPYEADYPQSFRSGLYLRCGDHWAASKAVESIPNRDENPDALYWFAVARYSIGGLEACRPSLLRLALLAPKRLPAAIGAIADPSLDRDWSAFQDACSWLDPQDETADAWFPAWYLLEHPDTRIALEAATLATTAVQAFVLIGRLIELERRGHSAELILARSHLRELAPELFAIYMARREAGRG